MKNKSINEILLDIPKMMEQGMFNKAEEELLMYPNLYHYQAFSPWMKYYLLLRYGNLIESLGDTVRNKNVTSFLEIGSGTGGTCIYIALNNQVDECLGVDLNEISVGIAKKRVKWHKAKKCKLVNKNFLEFNSSKKFNLIYSMAAFELIKPIDEALKKLVSMVSENGTIVLDMANPYHFKYKRKYLTTDDLQFMLNFFKENGFKVTKEYHSLLTGVDFTGLLKKNSKINKTIRIQATKTS